MSVKMRVGGFYRQRNGEIEEIVSWDNRPKYPWEGKSGNTYTDEGRYVDCSKDSPLDLIEELKPTADMVADNDGAVAATDQTLTAEQFLRQGVELLAERGKQYDSPDGERSMGKTVAAFNAITGRDLSDAEGWLLMLLLKQVRQFQADPHMDSAADGVNYAALLAEARMRNDH